MEANGSQENETDTEAMQKRVELVKAVYHNGMVALKMHFDEVEGQVLNHDQYGPVFIFHVKDEENKGYSCGFFLRELVANFQSSNDPSLWMASFYAELMKTKGGKAFPAPPASEDEAKAVIDKIIVPQCMSAVREEFAPEQIYAGLDWHKEYGPVFEAGVPEIKDGNNVCAVPIHLLLTHYLLNRDPSELLLQGLYRIRKEHGLE